MLVGLLLTLGLVTKSLAWWCTGHLLVAQIAELDLQEQNPAAWLWAQSAIEALGESLTHGTADTFVESACWADDIKVFGLETMNDWHFVNHPYNPYGIMNIVEYSDGDGLFALGQALGTLNSSSITDSPFETSFAMRYLIHLVGDLHQPLHVADMWSPAFPTGDLGGNLFPINFTDGITELHALWDSCLGHFASDPVRPLNATAWSFLESQASTLLFSYPRSALIQELSDPNPTSWATTNFQLAVKYAYNITQHAEPSNLYLETGWEVVQKQLALAGYRLSALVQAMYGTTS